MRHGKRGERGLHVEDRFARVVLELDSVARGALDWGETQRRVIRNARARGIRIEILNTHTRPLTNANCARSRSEVLPVGESGEPRNWRYALPDGERYFPEASVHRESQ